MSAPDYGTPDQPPTSPHAPVAGVGSTDLATDSSDPQELRALLDRARERLSFYESFDKIIAENLRHTGEMMAETVALRERAAEEVRKRQEADKAVEAERERYRSLLQSALAEVRTAQPVIDAMVARLQGALDEMDEDGRSTPAETTFPVAEAAPVETTATPEPERFAPDVPGIATPGASDSVLTEEPATAVPLSEEDAPETPVVIDGPSSIEVLAHNVPSAATAIGLQQMLRELDVITRVDTREFADGELRLHLEITGAIPDDTFSDWLARNSGSLVSRNAKAIELSFS